MGRSPPENQRAILEQIAAAGGFPLGEIRLSFYSSLSVRESGRCCIGAPPHAIAIVRGSDEFAPEVSGRDLLAFF
ncbi:MAG: hypothetical protein F6J93_36055 [Oscillatoria sp. SIO1A7]|nr:hypothetical protein [Oscillatoria sp. SIO1A7]